MRIEMQKSATSATASSGESNMVMKAFTAPVPLHLPNFDDLNGGDVQTGLCFQER
jgi:hypothetical protein